VNINLAIGDPYDVPEEARRGFHSEAFRQFLYHWFADTWALTRGEVDLAFLNDLIPEECELAKELLRRNLKFRQTHIIEGTAMLGDLEAVPMLRDLLSKQSDLSWQLTISGVLWKLVRDPSFPEYLNRMKTSESAILKQAHLHQILWLGDERAIDLLIDLLDDHDDFVRRLALTSLNDLEDGRRFLAGEDVAYDEAAYRKRRHDPILRRRLVDALRK
jgi:HEAT repeat protein